MSLSRYIFWSGLIAAVLAFAGYFIAQSTGWGQAGWIVLLAVGINYLATTVAFGLTVNGLGKDNNRFMNRLFGSMLMKILIGMVAILIIAFTNRGLLLPFVLAYLAAYLILTGFEVFALMRKLRPKI